MPLVSRRERREGEKKSTLHLLGGKRDREEERGEKNSERGQQEI